MTDDATQPKTAQPEGTEPASGSGKPDPTGVVGANPALDDTGNPKADEVGEAAEAPENLQDLDLTPAGLADEPAKQEDPDSLAEPENS
ncbi:hypothetical protein [Arthrobacter sp. ok362]|jgi:hypothetical protein|uniref:hypothetical protein n=1 Tax=Arthrobacter sp. ok362 TaxID=1761745 RepID=UPI000891E91D|nr:hypothetical protein [Arthrobacter sp. ok362]SDK65841.1 hypothetical protein SAMN04487913_102273 [Arthrobacter sp. ok362]